MTESMHHEHDLDLIDALLEGRSDDSRRAQELVDTCPECGDYLAARQTISAAVAEEPSPQLNDMERARLHRSLWQELEASTDEPAPQTSTKRSGTPWWYRLAPVAAVLVVAVGVGSLLGGESTEDSAEMRVAAESTAADTQDGAGADSATEMAPLSESGEDDAADGSAENTVASDTEEQTDATESASGDSTAAVSDTMTRFREEVLAGEVDTIDEAFDCEPPPDAGDLLAAARRTVAGEELWLAAYQQPDGATPVAAFRPSDCDLVDYDR